MMLGMQSSTCHTNPQPTRLYGVRTARCNVTLFSHSSPTVGRVSNVFTEHGGSYLARAGVSGCNWTSKVITTEQSTAVSLVWE